MGLKIGLVTGEFPPMEGGVGAFTGELAKALGESGHEVHIVTDRRARLNEGQRDFWNPRDPQRVGFAQVHPRVNRWWWSAASTVVDVALRYDLDVVNIQYQAAAYDMYLPAVNFLPWRLRGVSPTVVTFHDLRHPYLFPKAGRLRDWVVHYLARSASGVIATNAEDFEKLCYLGISSDRLRHIPIGSNVDAVTPAAGQVASVRRHLSLDDQDCLLGYFGFINASKGADVLLRTVAKLETRYQLVFLGGKVGSSDPTNEAYLAQIEALIDELGVADRVHWSGYLEDEVLSAYMAACDIMVMPYRDGASLRRGTLMAILAHGRPLVTTQAKTPAAALIHGQNVWMSAIDDSEALGDAIRTLEADEALREELGRRAKEISAQFTWDRIAAETAEFYRHIIAAESADSG